MLPVLCLALMPTYEILSPPWVVDSVIEDSRLDVPLELEPGIALARDISYYEPDLVVGVMTTGGVMYILIKEGCVVHFTLPHPELES